MSKADFKVIVIGPPDAGKTALMERFVSNQFRVEKTSTLGVSFLIKKWNGINLAIWDTCGQERFATLNRFYARDASAAIIAFDLTDAENFNAIDHWVAYLKDSDAASSVKVLVGCKLDLVQEVPSNRKVSRVDATRKAEEIGAVQYIETSSKTGEKISSVFDEICAALDPNASSQSSLSGSNSNANANSSSSSKGTDSSRAKGSGGRRTDGKINLTEQAKASGKGEETPGCC